MKQLVDFALHPHWSLSTIIKGIPEPKNFRQGSLKKGGRVSLVGFGSWSVSRRNARDGRNPQTGATIKIAAKNVVKFKAGAELSKSVN